MGISIIFSKIKRVNYTYYFSSCCETNQVFTFYGTEPDLSVDDGVYGTEFIDSETNENLNYQCSVVYNKISNKLLPPVNLTPFFVTIGDVLLI